MSRFWSPGDPTVYQMPRGRPHAIFTEASVLGVSGDRQQVGDNMAARREVSTKKIGLAPGTVLHTGQQKETRTHITLVTYGPESLKETAVETPDELKRPASESAMVTWVNVDGLHDADVISKIGNEFGIHPLALEDVVSVGALPQAAEYSDHVFTSLRMLAWGDSETVTDEHISLLLGSNWLLSFQERSGDTFHAIRDRLRRGTRRIRSGGADYLWYALLDTVVDQYIHVVGELESGAESLEERVWVDKVDGDVPSEVQRIRRESMVVRRAVRPLREQIDQLLTNPPDLVSDGTTIFLRDLKQHVLELTYTLETTREVLSSVMDAHLSLLSTRANDVMKVLTVVATVFIPITFIAGVYGMNFQHMPELAQRWGYPLVWLVMLGSAGTMLAYFRRKGWL